MLNPMPASRLVFHFSSLKRHGAICCRGLLDPTYSDYRAAAVDGEIGQVPVVVGFGEVSNVLLPGCRAEYYCSTHIIGSFLVAIPTRGLLGLR